MRGALGEFPVDLIEVFLVALLDLFLEELPERAVAQPFLFLFGKVGDEIGNQRTREPARLGVRIVRKEGVDGPCPTRRSAGNGWRRRGTWSNEWGRRGRRRWSRCSWWWRCRRSRCSRWRCGARRHRRCGSWWRRSWWHRSW